jgi:hypothetical protein
MACTLYCHAAVKTQTRNYQHHVSPLSILQELPVPCLSYVAMHIIPFPPHDSSSALSSIILTTERRLCDECPIRHARTAGTTRVEVPLRKNLLSHLTVRCIPLRETASASLSLLPRTDKQIRVTHTNISAV